MKIVKDSLKNAKWEEDKQRRIRMAKYLDFYRNDVFDYLYDWIDTNFNTAEADELKKFVEHENATERLINEISLVFADGLVINDGGDGSSEVMKQLSIDVSLLPVMGEVNKLVNLCFDIAVIPQVRYGKLVLDIITPERCFVEQDEIDPTKAKRFYYTVGQYYEDSPTKSKPIDIYRFWEDGKQFECNIDMETGFIYNIVKVENSLEYDENPIIMFRNYIPDDTFWSKAHNNLVHKNFVIDLLETDKRMAEAYEVPQRIDIGLPEGHEIKMGRTFKTNIPIDVTTGRPGDSKYIHPQSPIQLMSDMAQERIKQLALGYGLSTATINGDVASSGFHLSLVKYEILKRNQLQREFYRQPLKALLKLCIATSNMAGIGYGLDDNVVIALDFGEAKFPENMLERQQRRGLEHINGTRSVIDHIMEDNPDLTREEAIAYRDQIKNDMTSYGQKQEERQRAISIFGEGEND